METIVLKFNKIGVTKMDLRGNALNIAFHYDENGNPMKMEKKCGMTEDIDKFIHKVISEAKMSCRKNNASPVDDLDFLNHYTNIVLHQDENGSTVEKMVNAIKRFKDKVRNLKSLERHESYIQKYNELIGLKANLN